jgi:hypothetical protein
VKIRAADLKHLSDVAIKELVVVALFRLKNG